VPSAPPALADISELTYPGLEVPSIPDSATDAANSVASSLDLSGINAELLDNPLVVGGALVAVLAPLAVRSIVGGGPKPKTVSAAEAYAFLSEDEDVVFLDIRSSADARSSGSPDLSGTKKRVVSAPFTKGVGEETVEDEESFSKKVARIADPENAKLVIIDSDGSRATRAASIAIAAGYSTVLCVRGGCDGPRGWRDSGLPWKEPFRGFDLEAMKSLDITGMTKLAESLANEYRENPTAVKGGLAVAAAGAAGFILFNEVEIILEVLGAWAAFQFLAKRLLFADDRERTFAEIKSIIQDKIAAGDAGKDLKKLAATLFRSSSVDEIQDAAEADGLAATGDKAEARKWIASWRERTQQSEVAEFAEAARRVEEEESIEARREEVRAWIAAWKARTSVEVMA